MFTFKAVSVFLALASSAVAVPTASPWNGPWNGHGNWGHWWNKQCLTNAAAQNIVDAYVSLTSGAGPFDIAVAQALLAPGFSDSSSSIASVIDMGGTMPIPLLGETFNRSSFIGANAQAMNTDNVVLQVYHSCDVITFRFRINLQPVPIIGITILETVKAPKGNMYAHQVSQVYAELNSAAFLVDSGATITPPPPQAVRVK